MGNNATNLLQALRAYSTRRKGETEFAPPRVFHLPGHPLPPAPPPPASAPRQSAGWAFATDGRGVAIVPRWRLPWALPDRAGWAIDRATAKTNCGPPPREWLDGGAARRAEATVAKVLEVGVGLHNGTTKSPDTRRVGLSMPELTTWAGCGSGEAFALERWPCDECDGTRERVRTLHLPHSDEEASTLAVEDCKACGGTGWDRQAIAPGPVAGRVAGVLLDRRLLARLVDLAWLAQAESTSGPYTLEAYAVARDLSPNYRGTENRPDRVILAAPDGHFFACLMGRREDGIDGRGLPTPAMRETEASLFCGVDWDPDVSTLPEAAQAAAEAGRHATEEEGTSLQK